MQPWAERVGVAKRAGPPQEYQERRLEGVLDVARVVEQPPANAQHHRPMPPHERLEGRFIAARRKLA